MSDCQECDLKKDIKYIRDAIDEIKNNTKNQWKYINRNALKVTQIKTSLVIIIPIIYTLIKFLPRR